MKELNFKKWLRENGVDTELFWKNCKPENQRWGDHTVKDNSRECLATKIKKTWLSSAFNWDISLEDKGIGKWAQLSVKWRDTVETAVMEDTAIVFGF